MAKSSITGWLSAAAETLRGVRLPKLPRGSRKWIAAAATVGVLAKAAIVEVGPNQFAVRETLGNVTSGIKTSGISVQIPLVQFTHIYDEATQKIKLGAGSGRFIPLAPNTGDRNVVVADIVLNYQVVPDLQNLIYHRWAMRNWMAPDGYWLLTQMMNDSANAVFGKRPMEEILANPDRFINELYADLQIRLTQNNIPVKIMSLELQKFRTTMLPTRSVSYRVVGPAGSAPPPAPTN